MRGTLGWLRFGRPPECSRYSCSARAFAGQHVHHGLSTNADRWADFCTDYCRDLGIGLLVERVEVDRRSGLGLEAAAREARYRVFSGSAGGLLMLGHHQGDQAETLLFNLLRGTGVSGAAGMPVDRQHGQLRILRPLLDTSREEIEAYARQHALTWVDDESNADTGLTRNFLRHSVLTAVASRFTAAEKNLAQAAGRFAEAAILLDQLAAIDWQAAAVDDTLDLKKIRDLSPPRLKNLLRHRLRQLAGRRRQPPASKSLRGNCKAPARIVILRSIWPKAAWFPARADCAGSPEGNNLLPSAFPLQVALSYNRQIIFLPNTP